MVITLQVGIVLVLALFTCPYAYLLRKALKSGECFMKGQRATRAGEPVRYWATVVMLIAWVIMLPSLGIWFAFRFFL